MDSLARFRMSSGGCTISPGILSRQVPVFRFFLKRDRHPYRTAIHMPTTFRPRGFPLLMGPCLLLPKPTGLREEAFSSRSVKQRLIASRFHPAWPLHQARGCPVPRRIAVFREPCPEALSQTSGEGSEACGTALADRPCRNPSTGFSQEGTKESRAFVKKRSSASRVNRG